MSEIPSDGYSTLISFSTMEEAAVAVGALRASGVPAFLGNAHTSTVDWRLVPAMGGIQLMTPSSMIVQAKAILREPVTLGPAATADAEEEPYDPARRRDRWKGQVLLVWLFGSVALFLGGAVLQMAARIVSRLTGADSGE